MATVNFSVPEDVKQAFNAAFEGQNKSAVLTQLMREAVARAVAQELNIDTYFAVGFVKAEVVHGHHQLAAA